MGKNSNIAWTDHTANFWWGCQKVSDGCKNCYASDLSRRYGKNLWGPNTDRERKVGVWKEIFQWDQQAAIDGIRRRVFVSSMSDFLEDHPQVVEWRKRAMETIEQLKWLDVLLLTKRPENAPRLLEPWYRKWPAHVWFGVTVENQKATKRIGHLSRSPARIRFLSVEPMLERVYVWSHLMQGHVNWVICGGESGPAHRNFNTDWARDLRDQCTNARVPFFMKQLGGHPDHRDALSDFPEDLQIRKFPNENR